MANTVNNDEDNFEQEVEAYMQHMNQELQFAENLIQDMKNAPGEKNPYYQNLSQYIRENILHGNLNNSLEWAIAWEMWHDPSLLSYWKKADPNLTNINDPFVFNQSDYHKGQKLWDAVTSWDNVDTENFLARFGGQICKNDKDGQTVCAILEDLQYFDIQIKNDEAALKAIDPNINLTLVNQLNDLLARASDLAGDGLLQDDLNRAMQQFTVIFSHLCDILMDTIRADLATAGMKQFASSDDPKAQAAIMQFASLAIQAQFDELGSVQAIQDLAIDEAVDWQKEKSNAQADLNKPSNAFIDFFTGGNSNAGNDRAQIRAADAMIAILTHVENDISPLMNVDPGMQQFQIELDELKKKFQAFLGGHGTVQELKDAMVEALSILVGIIAETEKDSSMFDKEMNKGSMASSEMGMNDSLAQQQTIIAAKKYAAVMKTLLTVAQYVGMALLFILNPGFGMAVMLLIQAALTASGVMDKLQTALTDKFGDIGGTIMMCGIEAIGTAGGAAAIDSLLEKGVEAAVEAGAEVGGEVAEVTVDASVSKIAESAGEEAAAAARAGGATEEEAVAAGNKATENSLNAAKEVTRTAAKQSQKIALRKIVCMYLNKSIPELLSALKNGVKETAQTAMKEAAENAQREVQPLAETAAKQGTADVIAQTEIKSIAEKSANRAIASEFEISEESAQKTDKMFLLGERTAAKKFAVRAIFAGISAMGSTGLTTDLVALGQHKDKKDLSENWQIALQVIQTLEQFIGMIGASDVEVQSVASSGAINKLLLSAQAAQGGMEAIGDAGVASADFAQAHAVQGIAKDQSMMDTMQFIMSQLRKDGQLARDQYSKEMQQASKSNMSLAMHFNDANQEMAQAMSVLPV